MNANSLEENLVFNDLQKCVEEERLGAGIERKFNFV